VETVLALEAQVQKLRAENERLRRQLEELGTKTNGEEG
jgi:cell division protein FtsB